jgi:hypothetical protein
LSDHFFFELFELQKFATNITMIIPNTIDNDDVDGVSFATGVPCVWIGVTSCVGGIVSTTVAVTVGSITGFFTFNILIN